MEYISGIWKWNDNLDFSGGQLNIYAEATSAGCILYQVTGTLAGYTDVENEPYYRLLYGVEGTGLAYVYDSRTGWTNSAFQIIDFGPELAEVPDGTVALMEKYATYIGPSTGGDPITGITITAPVNVKPGKYHNITVTVEGTGDFDDSTVCNVHGANSPGTTLKASSTKNVYVLYVSPDETAESLEIYATSVQDPDVHEEWTCNVKSVWVESIKISTPREAVKPGEIMYFTCEAYGDEGVLPYAWDIALSGNTSSGTTVNKSNPYGVNATLIVGEDETSEGLLITVTSTQDRSVYATKKLVFWEGGFNGGSTGGGSSGGGGGSGGGTGEDGGDSGDGSVVIPRGKITSIALGRVEGDVKPGTSHSIAYNVKGTGVYNRAVIVTMEDNTSNGTKGMVSSDSRITFSIGGDEQAESVTLIVTSAEDEEIKATKSISINYEEEDEEGDGTGDSGGGSGDSGGSDNWEDEVIAEVTEIALTGLQSSVKPGALLNVGVVVDGVGDYDDGWKVSVSGNVSSNTYATKSTDGFKLKIGSNETAESITVTVTSTANKTVYTEETIIIEQPEGGSTPDDEVIENETATKEAIIQARKDGFYAGFQTAAAMYCKG